MPDSRRKERRAVWRLGSSTIIPCHVLQAASTDSLYLQPGEGSQCTWGRSFIGRRLVTPPWVSAVPTRQHNRNFSPGAAFAVTQESNWTTPLAEPCAAEPVRGSSASRPSICAETGRIGQRDGSPASGSSLLRGDRLTRRGSRKPNDGTHMGPVADRVPGKLEHDPGFCVTEV